TRPPCERSCPSSWSSQIPVCPRAFETEFRSHEQNSAQENATCLPGSLCGPAPSLQAPVFPPLQGIFRYPILTPRIQGSRNVHAQMFRTHQASVWFLLAFLLPFRGRCDLPATEIPLYAGTIVSAFPSARCCTTG